MAAAGETDARDDLSLVGPLGQLSLLVITCDHLVINCLLPNFSRQVSKLA